MSKVDENGFFHGYMQALVAAEPLLLIDPWTGQDYSGGERHATLAADPDVANGAPPMFAPFKAAKGNGSYYVRFDNVEQLIEDEFSFELVLDTSAASSHNFPVYGLWDGQGSNHAIHYHNSLYLDENDPRINSYASGEVLHYVLAVKAEGKARLYIEGELAGEADKGPFAETLRLLVGADDDSPGENIGDIMGDDAVVHSIAFFDRVLLEAEVAERQATIADSFQELYRAEASVRFGRLQRAVFWRPPPEYYSLRSSEFRRTLIRASNDIHWGGAGRITGRVTEEGVPVYRRVIAFDKRTKLPLADTWSHPVTGEYELRGLDPAREYFLVSFDVNGEFNAVVADYMYPERYQ